LKKTTIGERIAIARDKYGLSQAQLGATLGVTRAAISQYEQNKITPRPKVIDRLAELFNADPEWFDRGRGKAPDPLDVPVNILEINVERLTSKITDVRDLRNGRRWRLPTDALTQVEMNQVVAILAPNDAGPIQSGDRVLIDTRRCEGDGVFLLIDEQGASLRDWFDGFPEDARVVGRAVAYLRAL
jgi:transcriptional regulator with XRE-family HTH domain